MQIFTGGALMRRFCEEDEIEICPSPSRRPICRIVRLVVFFPPQVLARGGPPLAGPDLHVPVPVPFGVDLA